ncbi:MAG: arsenate reductase ArsC [Bacteroidales bacterium]|nr:arsenate reductase ArsC [Bacteroidales bacterium]
MTILILCTGNSCRSQMAEAFLNNMEGITAFSAGTNPSKQVHPLAIKVMLEEGIDISKNKPKNSNVFVNDSFDYVITVCDNAKESCPIFTGDVKKQIHMGFEDPDEVKGSSEFILSEFRRIRGEIKTAFIKFIDLNN